MIKIINLPDDWEEQVGTMPDSGIVDFLYGICRNGKPISGNASKGDAVKTLFSNTLDNFCERTTWEWNCWWNAPFQEKQPEKNCNTCDNYDKRNGCDGDYDYMCKCTNNECY